MATINKCENESCPQNNIYNFCQNNWVQLNKYGRCKWFIEFLAKVDERAEEKIHDNNESV